jgi:S-(hydroxymethyl)glutathione dehydrogenase / alcohol dehydrogenase
MRAAVFHDVGRPLTVESVELDEPRSREVVVSTAAAGVCHSDIHFIDGLWKIGCPAVMGHEPAGVVESVGSMVSYVEPGDHVICCLSVFCGTCDYCLRSRPYLCEDPSVRRATGDSPRITWQGRPMTQFSQLGAWAEKMLVHENSLVKIDDDIPFSAAALLGCGVLTGMGAALNTAKVRPGSTVAVFGAGGIGLSAIQGARIAGARQIIAVDVMPQKLERARAMGATDVVNGSETDAVKAIGDLIGGGVDYAFECIGLPATGEQTIAAARPGGTATIVGMMPLGTGIQVPGTALTKQAKTILGSKMGGGSFRIDVPRYLDLYRRGDLNLDDMVSRTLALDQINDAFRAMKVGEVARSVVSFE